MRELEIELTDTDRRVLESYKHFAEGLSDYLGDGYEIALHSLEDLDRSVIKIINGYYTGRSEGAPITDLALNMLAEIKRHNSEPYISYFTKNSRGEPMRSTTIAVLGEHDRIIGLLCMNFYLNTPVSAVMRNFTFPNQDGGVLSESFADNIGDMLRYTVEEVQKLVMDDSTIPVSRKKRAIVSELYGRGVFNLKDSVNRVAEILKISRNTVYMYLREHDDSAQ